MKWKHVGCLILLLFSLVSFQQQGFAQNVVPYESPWQGNPWALSLEIPLHYGFNQASDGDTMQATGLPLGVLVFAQTPLNLGLGFEFYRVKVKDDLSSSSPNQIRLLMVDLFYQIPFEKIAVAPGGGIGLSQVEGDYADRFSATLSSQVFIRFSYALPDRLQLYFSLHRINAQIRFKHNNYLLEAGGYMSSLGVGLEF